METPKEELEVTVEKKIGKMKVAVKGIEKEIPIELTITKTKYADGRQDCTITVPRIAMKGAQRR